MTKKNILKQYNQVGDAYSKYLEIKSEPAIEVFRSMIDLNLKDKVVLDLGCGDGIDAKFFVEKGATTYGFDASEEFLKNAREKIPQANFSVGDMQHLPYENETFDAVFSKYAIQTVYETQAVLQEIARVTKIGGLNLLLIKHPMRQFIEKGNSPKDYFKQELVHSTIFEGTVNLVEPSHTFMDYLSSTYLRECRLIDYYEDEDFPASPQYNKDNYACYFILTAIKDPWKK